jgi:uncharacterized protein
MAPPNEDLAREGLAAFARGDMEAVRQFLAEDTRSHFPGRSPLSGDYEGVAAVLGVFAKVFELSGGTFQSELHDVVANNEHIIFLLTDRAEREGRKLDDDAAQVVHVRKRQGDRGPRSRARAASHGPPWPARPQARSGRTGSGNGPRAPRHRWLCRR